MTDDKKNQPTIPESEPSSNGEPPLTGAAGSSTSDTRDDVSPAIVVGGREASTASPPESRSKKRKSSSRKEKSSDTAQSGRRRGGARLLTHMSRPLILEEGGPPRGIQYLLLAISLLVGTFIAWAAITEMPESAVAQGQVMPKGSVHVVQHLEGGIVSEIYVDEGEVVEAGQTVVRLEAASALSELEQLRAREAALALQTERMRAFVLGRDPDFTVGAGHPALVRDQTQILEIQIRARARQRTVLASRVDQRKAEIGTLIEQERHLKTQVRLIREQVGMRKKLLDKGLVSRTLFLETERGLTQALGDMARVVGEQARVREALNEAHGSLIELDARLSNEALTEMGSLSSELAQVRESLAKLEDRVSRLNVVAPARGVVKGLTTRTIGAVITPGQELMQIVPLEDEMVAEVQIRPLDIGHLRIGQTARVKVTTYDVSQFGPLEGKVKHISATTYEDEQGEPYYKGVIELDKNYVGHDPAKNPILPGMVVDADISTGSKTLMRYLLKPVFRFVDTSFTER